MIYILLTPPAHQLDKFRLNQPGSQRIAEALLVNRDISIRETFNFYLRPHQRPDSARRLREFVALTHAELSIIPNQVSRKHIPHGHLQRMQVKADLFILDESKIKIIRQYRRKIYIAPICSLVA